MQPDHCSTGLHAVTQTTEVFTFSVNWDDGVLLAIYSVYITPLTAVTFIEILMIKKLLTV